MKKNIFIILLCFIQQSVFSQQIEFFNIGWQDKPMDDVILSTKKMESSEYSIKYILVNIDEYKIVKEYVIVNNTHEQPILNSYQKDNYGSYGCYDFGCYAVQLIEKQDSLLYFMSSSSKSVFYFNGLVALLDKNKFYNISKEFKTIINRLPIIKDEKIASNTIFQYKCWIIGGICCIFILALLIVKFYSRWKIIINNM